MRAKVRYVEIEQSIQAGALNITYSRWFDGGRRYNKTWEDVADSRTLDRFAEAIDNSEIEPFVDEQSIACGVLNIGYMSRR